MSTTTRFLGHYRTMIALGLWFLAVVLLVTYLFLMSLSILYLVEREHTQKQISELEVTTSQLVTEYLDRTRAIDLSLAYQLGFEPIAERRIFAVRQPEVVTLSWLDNEI